MLADEARRYDEDYLERVYAAEKPRGVGRKVVMALISIAAVFLLFAWLNSLPDPT